MSIILQLHFEESQFEIVENGKQKLKKSAIPTLFNVPNPPKRLDAERNSVFKKSDPDKAKTSSVELPDQVRYIPVI